MIDLSKNIITLDREEALERRKYWQYVTSEVNPEALLDKTDENGNHHHFVAKTLADYQSDTCILAEYIADLMKSEMIEDSTGCNNLSSFMPSDRYNKSRNFMLNKYSSNHNIHKYHNFILTRYRSEIKQLVKSELETTDIDDIADSMNSELYELDDSVYPRLPEGFSVN